MAGQTLNDHTTDATMVPAIIDHLMPGAISKNLESTKWKAQLIEISACRAGANWLNVITSYHTFHQLWICPSTHTHTHGNRKHHDTHIFTSYTSFNFRVTIQLQLNIRAAAWVKEPSLLPDAGCLYRVLSQKKQHYWQTDWIWTQGNILKDRRVLNSSLVKRQNRNSLFSC